MRIVLVNNYKEPEKAQQALQNLTRTAGQPVTMVDRRTPELAEKVADLNPDLLVLSGSNSLLTKPGTREQYQNELDLVKDANYPVLGICFGHQLIGTSFGAGMTDLGRFVRGFERVRILDHHPLFSGLPETVEVAESHRQVLDMVPPGFLRLAGSESSQIEAMCHENRPIYSVQFHPERAEELRPHGRLIFQNLLKIAKQ